MSDLGWRADGIERAIRAGGIELELYRRPGFTGGRAVRRPASGTALSGFETGWTEDPTPTEFFKGHPR